MNVSKDAHELLEKGTTHVKQSSYDWFHYIETHPFQSMLFGLIGYFAIKGLTKENNK